MCAYAYRCWLSTGGICRSMSGQLILRRATSRSAPHYVSSMQQHGPWSPGGNAISSLASLPLESSNCQAQTSTCFCQMRLTSCGRYEHSRPHCPSKLQVLVPEKRRRKDLSMKLSATAKEAVADVQVEISQKKATQARTRAARSRHAKTAVLNSLTSAPASEHTTTRFASSSPGTVRSPASRSTAPSCSGIGFTSNTQICAGHDQSSARRGPADRVRGSRRRPAMSRTGRRYPSGEGSATDRRAPRELADARAGSATAGVRDAVNGPGVAGSRDGRDVDWVRLRGAELLTLRLESIQQREEHWMIADLVARAATPSPFPPG